MHEVVLADGRNHLGGYRSVAVLIFMGLGRDVIGLADVDERTGIHLKLYKANVSALPHSSHGSIMTIEVGEKESIRKERAHIDVDQFRGILSMRGVEKEEEVCRP